MNKDDYSTIYRNLRAVRSSSLPLTVRRDPWWWKLIRKLWGLE